MDNEACDEGIGADAAAKIAAWDKKGTSPPYLKPTEEHPDMEQLEEWVYDSICEATDGCTVEPDGYCEHAHVSWLLYLGLC